MELAGAVRARPSADRNGFALLSVLLVLVVVGSGLAAFAASSHAAARVADTRARVLEARAAATGAVHAALGTWPTAEVAALAPGDTLTLAAGVMPGGARYAATVERLAPSLALVRGYGAVRRGVALAEWRVGRLVALGDHRDLAASVLAAVSAVGPLTVSAGAHVSADGPAGVRLDSAAIGSVLEGTISGTPPVDPSGFDGATPFRGLAPAADRVEAGALAPAPRVDGEGACDETAAGNWGDPAGGACGGYAPIIRAPADLVVEGGVGQGVLIAEGDLVLGPGAVFRGLVLALGDVHVAAGATLQGALIAASPGAAVRVEGEVALLPSDLADAVRQAVAGRPFDPPGRRWIPLF